MDLSNIAIIGCGNLGQAIAKGLLDAQAIKAAQLTVTNRNPAALQHLAAKGVKVTSDNKAAIENSTLILVALKPHNILTVLADLKSTFDPKRHVVISVATGITLSELHGAIQQELPIFRAMPNTAADVQQSVTCICGNEHVSPFLEPVKKLFNTIGTSIVINEELMEAATVLGACGIAFVLRFMRAMVQGGIQIGFDSKTASQIVNQTVLGASKLLIERKEHPEFEIDKVTTPKGCTIAGLNEMEHNGFSSALIKGITTSFEKIEK